MDRGDDGGGALFIGREDDLGYLEQLYGRGEFVTCAVSGRRRIGKTCLLENFCKDKDSLFFRFRRGSLAANLHHMHRVLSNHRGNPYDEFRMMEDALAAVTDVCERGRTVVVFDEYPYVSASGDSVSSDFQHFIDTTGHTDAMVVFCGSSISSMRTETENYSSPLYGRILSKRRIDGLSLQECMRFHPAMSDLDQLRLYLTVGGVPLYHLRMKEGTYRECIAGHFLGGDADLRGEAENIVTCELSPRDSYFAVVEAVAAGCTRVKEIVERSGIPRSTCDRCLDDLAEIGVIGTVDPMAMRKSTPPMTIITDDVVAFGYEVVQRFDDLLSFDDPLGSYDAVYDEIASFLGRRFELFCSDYIRRNYRTLEIGKWWGRFDGADTDVDIIARVSDGRNRYTLYCECKFRRRETTYRDFQNLKDKVSFINSGSNENVRYMIFSASGFSDTLLEAEEDTPLLKLVDLDMLIGRKPCKPLRCLRRTPSVSIQNVRAPSLPIKLPGWLFDQGRFRES